MTDEATQNTEIQQQYRRRSLLSGMLNLGGIVGPNVWVCVRANERLKMSQVWDISPCAASCTWRIKHATT